MKRLIILGLALAFIFVGAITEVCAQGKPVLEEVWAPEAVNWGDMVKIYIKGNGGGGELRWINISAKSTGNPALGASPIRVTKDAAKEINGFLYYSTKMSPRKMGTAWVEISLEDRNGNESETKTLKIELVDKGAKKATPPSSFQNREIAPIMLPGAIHR